MTRSAILPADGDQPCEYLVVGERPGYEEYTQFTESDEGPFNFIGPAGRELWDRLWRVCRIDRSDCRVANLVPTFSPQGKAPTPAEISEHAWRLRNELIRTRPTIVIPVGYHAARFFLPQFADVNGDYFHGLTFEITYGRITERTTLVVPLVHSSAALRQPGRYQQQLTDDCRGLKRAIDQGRAALHVTRPLVTFGAGLAQFFDSRRLIGCDTEYGNDRVEAITLAHDLSNVALINGQDQPAALPHIHTICSTARLVAHAAPAEYHSLLKLGVERWDQPIDDTMIMAYVLGRPHRGLKTILYREFGLSHPSYDDIVGPVDDLKVMQHLLQLNHKLIPRSKKPAKGTMTERTKRARRCRTSIAKITQTVHLEKSQRQRWNDSVWKDRYPLPPAATWKDAPQQIREPYAQGDAAGTLIVRDTYWPEIESNGLRRVYGLDRDVLPFLVRNEHIGLAVDVERLEELSRQFRHDYQFNLTVLRDLVGHAINPLSAPEVSRTLFEELGVRPTKMTKSGKHHTTSDKYLKARRGEHEAINLILDSRQLNKYTGTYTNKLPDMLRDGRYHPDWGYAVTATGRLSETILVLIPKHDLLAKIMNRANRATAIRNCFYATPGHRLVSVDLSQIELRVMAHLSQDPKLLRAFRTGLDMHAMVAADLLGAPKKKDDQDESLHRLPAKTMNFGIINGMTEYGMLDQLHEAGQLQWDLDQVREFRTEWFKQYQGVDHFWRAQIAHGRGKGYVVSMFGRRRYLHGLKSTNEQVRLEAERQALFAIQSSADDISKLWNIRIWRKVIRLAHKEGWYCEPWVRVHDDTTVEADKKKVRDVSDRMLGLVPDLLDVPTTAEAKSGRRWGSLNKIAA